MESELTQMLSSGDLVSLAVLAVILLAVLFVLRIMFKLTATLFRLGCFVVVFIVGAVALFMYLG
jgi:hypothetical protein